MNVLFLTIGRIGSIENHGIYTDLLRCFRNNGHNVYIVHPYEKRTGLKTKLVEDNGVHILSVSIGNITKCSMIEKGISTLQIESKFLYAIKKYIKDVTFDLVLYSTPPITFVKVIQYIKKKDNAKSYLLLKDIFPQNAVDLGILSTKGIKGILYQYFRKKEKKLYQISDYIGCMSQANVDYVLKHNPEIKASKVEICPNCIEVLDINMSKEEKDKMRERYNIPLDKKVFVYGGNLGKPQGINFMMECLRSQKDNSEVFFLIVGAGTEYGKIEKFIKEEKQQNVKLMEQMPKDDYDRMIASCDIGMIFLDYRFTIPNFPSRLLAYMQARLPVLACTDSNTDIGKVIAEDGFGWWCESSDIKNFKEIINQILAITTDKIVQMKNKEIQYLRDNYSSEKVYQIIVRRKK